MLCVYPYDMSHHKSPAHLRKEVYMMAHSFYMMGHWYVRYPASTRAISYVWHEASKDPSDLSQQTSTTNFGNAVSLYIFTCWHMHMWARRSHMCDRAHSYVWHEAFICVTGRMCMRDMRYLYVRHEVFPRVTCETSICVTWGIHMGDMVHWYVCDMVHWYVWHEAFICVTWDIGMCDMPHSYVWGMKAPCWRVTWEGCLGNPMMSRSYVWNEAFTGVTSGVHMCDMRYSYVWHDALICVTWDIKSPLWGASEWVTWKEYLGAPTLQHTATHYNTLQHTATLCNTLHQKSARYLVTKSRYLRKRALFFRTY